MSYTPESRKGRTSENVQKQKLKQLYSQFNFSQQESHNNKGSSLDHGYKDTVIKDQTFLSNNQNLKTQQILRAYKFLTNNSEGQINLSSLKGFLEQQGQSMYTGVQMISLLDKQNKGFVDKQEFFNFFQKGISGLVANVPQEMKRDQQLVKIIDKHHQGLLKNFTDPQYCEYAAKQIKRFKYSQQL